MPYLNFVSTEAGADAQQASTGYFEYGSDKTNTVGSFPFRVDQSGNITAKGALYSVAASGDTTGATDTAAIQALLNAIPANGGTVMLGPGVFYLNATLNPTVTGTRIIGSGWGTQVRYDGNVVSPAIGMADTTQRRVNIAWLRLSQTNATAHGTAIEASYFTDSAIEHVLIDGGGSGVPPLIGISFNSATTFYNVVSDSRVNCSGANSIGIRFDTGANSNVCRNVRVIPDAAQATSIGIYVNARSIELDHPDIENAAGTGISLGSTGHGCTITAPYLEANGTNLSFASGVNSPTVTGGTIENGTTADITDSGALTPKYLNVRSSVGGEHSVTKALVTELWQPEDVGLISWNYDPALCSNTSASVNGTIYLARLPIRYATTVSKLAVFLSTGATTPTASENYFALVNSAGTIVCSTAATAADAPTATAGWCSVSVSSATAVTPGLYWVAVLLNAGTPATFARGTGSSLTGANVGLTASSYRFAANGTAATALPGSFTPGSNTQTGAIAICVGVS